MSVDLAYAFGLPPEKAIEYFQSKGFKIGWDWHETLDAAHTKAFTVAKVMKADVLEDIRGALNRALVEGTTLQQFKKDLVPTLKQKGWWGEIFNEQTGEIAYVTPRRLDTIYQANLQSAYMAGRYQSMQENARNRPYWMYISVLDGRTRPAHRALHGKVFRYDDPIWSYIYPPNGFRCRCRVTSLSAAEVAARGIKVDSSAGKLDFIETPLAQGENAMVARYRGVDEFGKEFSFSPDPGWNSNPGEAKLWYQPPQSVKVLPGQKTWSDYGRPDLRQTLEGLRTPAPQLLSAGKSQAEAVEILAGSLGIEPGQQFAWIEAADGETLLAHRDRLPHMVEKRQDARERYGNYVMATLKDPYEVWLTGYGDGLRKQYIGVFTGKYDLQVVVKEEKDGTIVWNFMQADDRRMNSHRVGTLLTKKE